MVLPCVESKGLLFLEDEGAGLDTLELSPLIKLDAIPWIEDQELSHKPVAKPAGVL